MRFMPAVACLIVAYECAQKAMGEIPQELINPAHVWVWWFPAASWAFAIIPLFFPTNRI
jgi:hypothetical protein